MFVFVPVAVAVAFVVVVAVPSRCLLPLNFVFFPFPTSAKQKPSQTEAIDFLIVLKYTHNIQIKYCYLCVYEEALLSSEL